MRVPRVPPRSTLLGSPFALDSVKSREMEVATDLAELQELKQRFGTTGNGAPKSIFMDIYAVRTRAYMERSGATAEDFARIAVKSHRYGSVNPRAQYREEVTIKQVLDSR